MKIKSSIHSDKLVWVIRDQNQKPITLTFAPAQAVEACADFAAFLNIQLPVTNPLIPVGVRQMKVV